jgi:glutamine synthetase
MKLTVAALVAAGIDGIRSAKELAWKDSQMSPSLMTEVMREELGIRERLPLSLKEAVEAAKCASKLGEILSRDLVERFLKLKSAEARSL